MLQLELNHPTSYCPSFGADRLRGLPHWASSSLPRVQSWTHKKMRDTVVIFAVLIAFVVHGTTANLVGEEEKIGSDIVNTPPVNSGLNPTTEDQPAIKFIINTAIQHPATADSSADAGVTSAHDDRPTQATQDDDTAGAAHGTDEVAECAGEKFQSAWRHTRSAGRHLQGAAGDFWAAAKAVGQRLEESEISGMAVTTAVVGAALTPVVLPVVGFTAAGVAAGSLAAAAQSAWGIGMVFSACQAVGAAGLGASFANVAIAATVTGGTAGTIGGVAASIKSTITRHSDTTTENSSSSTAGDQTPMKSTANAASSQQAPSETTAPDGHKDEDAILNSTANAASSQQAPPEATAPDEDFDDEEATHEEGEDADADDESQAAWTHVRSAGRHLQGAAGDLWAATKDAASGTAILAGAAAKRLKESDGIKRAVAGAGTAFTEAGQAVKRLKDSDGIKRAVEGAGTAFTEAGQAVKRVLTDEELRTKVGDGVRAAARSAAEAGQAVKRVLTNEELRTKVGDGVLTAAGWAMNGAEAAARRMGVGAVRIMERWVRKGEDE
ncbi:hypothetical protein PAPYR_13307 [Paratrimastix pyriformis]|uniref:Uncharacterized protein n=1 Tax=Paratrimastix pyriformis TaxID=342808 RepID=A0ABQ8U2T9_9EUKA|nr:hypothetical protein PAPYR_13307 [Paratrimastix pyriformis]